MRFCKKWFLLTFVPLSMEGFAQTDFPLSMLTSSHIQLNPSSAGLLEADYRVQGYFKSQMARAMTGGIKASGVALDYNFAKWKMGLGLAIFSNSVDRSALNDFNLLLSYAYRVELNDQNLFSLGLQMGFKQMGFSTESLTFGSQYDPSYLGGYNPNLQPSISTQSNQNNFDASVGAQWYTYLNPFLALKIGASAFHLFPVKTGFFTTETYLKPKYVFHANVRYESEKLHWIPEMMWVTQDAQSYIETGLTTQFRRNTQFFNVGLYYRSPKVIIPTIGIGLGKLALNLSLEYYLQNSYTQIFNIGISYFPQTNKKPVLIEEFEYI